MFVTAKAVLQRNLLCHFMSCLFQNVISVGSACCVPTSILLYKLASNNFLKKIGIKKLASTKIGGGRGGTVEGGFGLMPVIRIAPGKAQDMI